MAAIARSTASLRIFGDALDPAELSIWLHATPDEAWLKGDPWIARGQPVRSRRTGAWFLSSTLPADALLEDHVRDVLDRTSSDVTVWQKITRIYDADVFCGLWMECLNEGFALPRELISSLADRNLMIDFDIYGPLRDEAT